MNGGTDQIVSIPEVSLSSILCSFQLGTYELTTNIQTTRIVCQMGPMGQTGWALYQTDTGHAGVQGDLHSRK
jgi:hypothetical protein